MPRGEVFLQFPIVVLAFGVGLWPFITGTIAFVVSFLFMLMFAALLMRSKVIDEEEKSQLQGERDDRVGRFC